ncbi:hypothetical protein ACU5P1_17155 [Pseudomonas plecoglossicida]|uniref:Uncharacterized protein n=1 Tax=Pseudomonas plecoglossicida TaxID=70775 RepID=A0AAD0QWF2_PSEDL|nr:hypothetical protein [Pseudomonas plecoglossicida]AXM95642.1 hypothetical protein DVB73_07455 [Pseudomonas plecoglossicida]EPB94459.1 hypothetical protein L321_18987 [Pseudomonas plecoglossicida NB2011]QLB56390.1 hypothetical protein HAV28_16985 [Pseudomonas plecoglossicida]
MNVDDFDGETLGEFKARYWSDKFVDERKTHGEELFVRIKRFCIHELAPDEYDSYVGSDLLKKIDHFYENLEERKADLLEFELSL